jgi:hypothetical protein
MHDALTLRMTTVRRVSAARAIPAPRLSAHVDRTGPGALDSVAWPVMWARCWCQIRTWPVPPRWSYCDWCDEARAQGALADFQARRNFDPRRTVPLDGFRYRRVVDSVWTRHRQECSFGRRTRFCDAIPDCPAPARPEPDLDTLACLDIALDSLAEPDLGLIRKLFWDGLCDDELAREWGVSRQAVNKRKLKILCELRRKVVMP